ncbi:MAG: hypothetical protein KDI82_00175 [Gammaproteobacteria bacterium]|nr:hypothetical protein [Gammaproteobacteria bacterium]
MNKTFLIGAVLLGSIVMSSALEARTYVRWCSANFRIIPMEAGLDNVRDTVRTTHFRARASGGWYIPNTIRLRAYRRARDCINTAWADPYNGSVRGVPAACTNSGGNGIYDYNPTPSLLGDLANSACHAWGPAYRGRYVNVRIVADISGDWGCGGSTRSKSTFIPLTGNPSSLVGPHYRLWIPARCDT